MLAKRSFLVAIILFLAWQWLLHRQSPPAPAATPAVTVAGPAATDNLPTSTRGEPALAVDVGNADLPPQALATLRLIARNGPFPYERDGVVFGNFEQRLPEQPRGYYREYTVPTPGAHNRGARRIITGGDPPRLYYYTDDHYGSFRRIGGRP